MSFDAEGFAHRVRSARVWRGIVPKELAIALGRTDQAIYDLESGSRRTPPDKLLLRALASELGQTEEWLLSGTEPPWVAGSAGANELDLEIARLRRLNDQLEQLLDRTAGGSLTAASEASARAAEEARAGEDRVRRAVDEATPGREEESA